MKNEVRSLIYTRSMKLALVSLILLSSTIIVGLASAAGIRGWQQNDYYVGFSDYEGWVRGPYVYYPLTIYVKLLDTDPEGRSVTVRYRWGANTREYTISEGQYTPSVYPNGVKTFVYFIGTEPQEGDYDASIRVYFYD